MGTINQPVRDALSCFTNSRQSKGDSNGVTFG